MAGYIVLDKHKTAAASRIVAVLPMRGKKRRAAVISKDGSYFSKTTAKRLVSRMREAEQSSFFYNKNR